MAASLIIPVSPWACDHERTGRSLADLSSIGPCTYELLGGLGVLLYVGATRQPAVRVKQHSLSKPWWREVHHLRVTPADSYGAALAYEDHLIETAEPAYNRTGPRYARTKAMKKVGLPSVLGTLGAAWGMPS